MRPEIAGLFHRVVSHGLFVKERLRDMPQENLAFLAEQHAALHGLLIMAHPAQNFPDYTGEPAPPAANALLAAAGRYPSDQFLGIRYALACWLDEMLISGAQSRPWVGEWWEVRKLETKLYPPLNERKLKYWEQARLAEERPHIDALEGYYLCVMLGFRGMHQGRPQELQQWRQRVQPRLVTALHQPWRDEPRPRLVQPTREPLSGSRAYNRMRAAVLALGALATLAFSLFFFHWLLS
jgi:type IV/VI secretion system ImpK/VasF family protein